MILDIHTHNSIADPQAIIDISEALRKGESLDEMIQHKYSPEQRFSVGIHPWWLTEEIPDSLIDTIENAAQHPQVAIIGEVGIDTLKGGPLFRQMIIFKKMVEISETVKKPLIIHNVKAHEIILNFYKELKPRQSWIIHGFRSKPNVARMFVSHGIGLSFGNLFNPMTIHNVPSDFIFAETDDSGLPISEVLHLMSDARGTDITHFVAENTARLLQSGDK